MFAEINANLTCKLAGRDDDDEENDDDDLTTECMFFQVAVEMLAALLHLQNDYALEDFVSIRHRAMVALTVACPKDVCDLLLVSN